MDNDVARKEFNMWLDNLKRLKKEKGISTRQIVEITKLPEKTVSRILSGDTDSPRIDTLLRIATALDISFDDIFADTKFVVVPHTHAEINEELKNQVAILTEEIASLKAEMLNAEMKHKDELLALHKSYHKIIFNK